MRNNLKIITTETFGDLSCNFYRNMNDDILLTREQIGSALEYKYPDDALSKIHKRHKNKLEKFYIKTKIKSSDGKFYNTHLYTLEGVITICSLSTKEKAYEFSQWLLNLSNSNNNIKVIKSRKEIEFMVLLKDFLNEFNIHHIQQYQYENYKIDLYLPEFKIAIEYDEEDHKYYTYKQQEYREQYLKQHLGCKFIRLSDNNSNGMNIAIIIKELFSQTEDEIKNFKRKTLFDTKPKKQE